MLTGTAILVYWLIVTGVAILASFIHYGIIEEFDFIDFISDFFAVFFEEFVWITFLACFALGGIVFGFLNWYWWAMLPITLTIVLVSVIIVIVLYQKNKKEEREFEEISKKKTETTEQTSFDCPNCGTKIVKTTVKDFFGNTETNYHCVYCDTKFDKRQIFKLAHPDAKIDETFDLDDWEEEYFDACEKLFFKPHNHHSEKQIDRRVDSIKERIDNFEEVYETDSYDQEDILNDAYDFFINDIDEIEDYLKKYSKEEIQKRFSFYCLLQEMDDAEN